jgi:hypothetical protein
MASLVQDEAIRYLTLCREEVVCRVALAWTPVHFNRTWLMAPKNTFWNGQIFYLSIGWWLYKWHRTVSGFVTRDENAKIKITTYARAFWICRTMNKQTQRRNKLDSLRIHRVITEDTVDRAYYK